MKLDRRALNRVLKINREHKQIAANEAKRVNQRLTDEEMIANYKGKITVIENKTSEVDLMTNQTMYIG